MILVWGPADDPPAERVLAALRGHGAATAAFGDEALAALRYDVAFGDGVKGTIEAGGTVVKLDSLRGFYLRPGASPRQAQPEAELLAASTLLAVAAASPAIVVNRPWAGRSNWSKPSQLQLIAGAGLAVPDTLVTTDPGAARAFLAAHGRIVYKSISGIRSIVATLGAADSERLDGVATGPVQLQRWIEGVDVRVHVVGDRWWATRIDCAADDYRYAARDGIPIAMAPIDLPPALGERLVRLSRGMGLLVSGIDLRLTGGGDWYCLEVNPSPGFTYYEDATGQPIAEAIAALLMGEGSG